MGAPLGNQNGAKAKRWQKALERALARFGDAGEVDKGLDGIADKVVAAAHAGDVTAWKEIGDRMDGKPAQAVTVSGDPDNPLQVAASLSDDTLAAIAAGK